MADPKAVASEKITKHEFDELLDQYSILIEGISASKGVTKGQRTLQELDQFRYVEAPDKFGHEKSSQSMSLDDVKILVDWKLRHGKFRPTLMKLVTSNDATFASETIQTAITPYRKTHDVSAALATLTKLKGIGPATASLLLSVHDPAAVIFFSDEAFYWLCCAGKKSPMKYNAKEYEALRSAAGVLVEKLGVSATDVEKVAYVLMKQPLGSEAPKKAGVTKANGQAASSSKRKAKPSQDEASQDAPTRRSKRTRA